MLNGDHGFDDWDSLPGGDNFFDVTALFPTAAASIDPAVPIFADGYTMHDAMSALEIGEPRMDSGMILKQQRTDPFNPLTPLLPLEVCWILDRSFSCEMEWHVGNTLSQTVYTFLYVHNLEAINPDFFSRIWSIKEDTDRPIELVTLVIRAAVSGLLKTCALAWVELSKSQVYDQEDWQSEKSEISLYEGTPVLKIIARLDEAMFWLANTPKVQNPWRDAILTRLRLRKTILEVAALELPKQRDALPSKIEEARLILQKIRAGPPIELPPNSPATLAFDPFITRRLHSFMPLRVLELPSQEQTWNSLDALFSSSLEMYHLSGATSLTEWQNVGFLRSWSPVPSERLPYVRSLTQTLFQHGNRVLTGLAPTWLVDRFFLESIGVSYERISNWIDEYWTGPDEPPMLLFETRIIKLVKDDTISPWYNLPRRRRHLMNIIPDWHVLHDLFARLVSLLDIPTTGDSAILRFLPHIPLLWRLSAITNVIYSGFQLDLYATHEKPFAYWHASQVLETNLGCIEDLLQQLTPGSAPHSAFRFQHTFLTALQCMSIAMTITISRLTSVKMLRDHGFGRRHKWAHKSGAAPAAKVTDISIPNVEDFLEDCESLSSEDPADSWNLAKEALFSAENDVALGLPEIWCKDRLKLIHKLRATCEEHLQTRNNELRLTWEQNAVFPRY